MSIPKYVQRIGRLPEVFEVLAAHPTGMSLGDLAATVGADPAELHDDLLAFYTADFDPVLFGLRPPPGLEFYGPGGESDPAQAEFVRLVEERPGEEIGVEQVDAAELALVYTAAMALRELNPDDTDLAGAIEVLTDAIFGEEKPTDQVRSWNQPVETLREAIDSHHRVRIDYSRSWYQGVIGRVIDPYRLVQTRRGWEVDAGPPDEQGRLRTYLVANLRSVDVLDESYQDPPGLEHKLAEQRTTTRVRVRIPHSAHWAADFQAESTTVVIDDEFTTTLDLDMLPPVRHRLGLLLLAAGIDAQVLDPPGLVMTGPALAAQLLEHHRG